MRKRKSTKRTMFASLLSLMISASLLIGTTFAWFTSSDETAVNKIISGKLTVILADSGGISLEDKTLNFKNVDGSDDILWEPGATFALDSFKIINGGNLALKYTVRLDGVKGDEKLLEALEFTVKIGDADAVALDDINGILLPAGATPKNAETELVGESELITIFAHMKEDAENEYQDLSIEGLSVVVVATQYTYESDIYDDQYDKDAANILVTDAAELEAVLAEAKPGDVIEITEAFTGSVTLPEGLTGVTIKAAEGAVVTSVEITADGIDEVTFTGFEFTDVTQSGEGAFLLDGTADIGELTFEKCSFTGAGTKSGRGLANGNANADIIFENCSFSDMGYPIWNFGGFNSLSVNNCSFNNILSWCILPQGAIADVSITNNIFTDCGEGIFKTGTVISGSFVFEDNILTNCAGHDGLDTKFFEITLAAAATSSFTGNTRDGAEWTPDFADVGINVQ